MSTETILTRRSGMTLVGAALLTLVGCAANTMSATIAAMESGLTAADDAALDYLQLPVCTGTNGPLCGDPTIRANIKTAAGKAYALIKQAEVSNAAGTTPDLTAAETALSAYQTIIASTKGS